MVVLALCPSVSVEVLIDSQPATEYEDPNATPPRPGTTVRYIEALSDIPFVIEVMFDDTFSTPSGHVEMQVDIDEECIDKMVIQEPELRLEDGYVFAGKASVRNGIEHVEQDLRFNDLIVSNYSVLMMLRFGKILTNHLR